MKYLLDTNICIYITHDRSQSLRSAFGKFNPGDIAISSITLGELAAGAALSSHGENAEFVLQKFLSPLVTAPFDSVAALSYGKLFAELKKKGTSIGRMDLLIAAHAKALDATLVTNNIRDFRRVPGLRVEDWVHG